MSEIIPLEIPPGIVMNGSVQERASRWINGSFIRFTDTGSIAPMLGEDGLTLSGDTLNTEEPLGAGWMFIQNGPGRLVALGKETRVYVLREDFVGGTAAVKDITPVAGFDPTWAPTTLASWSFANLGDTLLFSRAGGPVDRSSGALWQYDTTQTTNPATLIADAPSTTVRGVVVTPEQFVMILGEDREIKWADQGSATTWIPAVDNSAGGLTVSTAGQLVRLLVVRGETLALGDQDMWGMEYVGGDLAYGARKLGDHCGIIGPQAVAVAGNTAYWMGPRGFFKYDGFVSAIECPLSEAIFGPGGLEVQYGARVFAISVPNQNEIWWCYPVSLSHTPQRCVRYNTLNGTWVLDNPLIRAAGVDAVWPPLTGSSNLENAPVLFDANGQNVYVHDAVGIPPDGAFVESGPFMIENGKRRFLIERVIPDGAAVGDEITLYTGDYAQMAESSFGVTVAAHGPQDVRLNGRYVRYKQTLSDISSRVGLPTISIVPGGLK